MGLEVPRRMEVWLTRLGWVAVMTGLGSARCPLRLMLGGWVRGVSSDKKGL